MTKTPRNLMIMHFMALIAAALNYYAGKETMAICCCIISSAHLISAWIVAAAERLEK